MRVISKLCKTMNIVNEDAICYGKNFAFILDGHSMDTKGSKVTKWHINNFKKHLKKNIEEGTFLNVLNKTIKTSTFQFKNIFPKEQVPAISACLVRKKNDKLEVLVVGNAKCLIQTKKIELVEDPRMDKVENNILQKMNNLKKQKNINMIDARNSVNDMLMEIKSKTNSISGYPAIKDKKLTLEDVVYKEYNYDDVISAVICSDGFYAYKSYLKIKDKDLYDLINNQGLLQCYKHIRRMEEKDLKMDNFPRINFHDDASAIHIIFY